MEIYLTEGQWYPILAVLTTAAFTFGYLVVRR